MSLVNFVRKQLQTVFIRNILDHDRSPTISLDHLVVDLENPTVVWLLIADRPLVTVIIRWVHLVISVTEGAIEAEMLHSWHHHILWIEVAVTAAGHSIAFSAYKTFLGLFNPR